MTDITLTDEEIKAEARRRYNHQSVRDRYDADLLMAGFEDGASWAVERIAARQAATRCSECGGLGGVHGLVHVRHDNGGGSNRPCSKGPRIVARSEAQVKAEALREAQAALTADLDDFPDRGMNIRARWACLWLRDRADRILAAERGED